MPEKRGHEVSEKPKSIPLPHLTGPGNGEDSFGETLSVARLITEADLAPLNGRPDGPFGRIVGWLDTLNAQKSEEDVPVLQEAGGTRPDVFIRTLLVAQARAFYAAPDKGAGLPQLFAGATGFFESMPVAEKRPGFL